MQYNLLTKLYCVRSSLKCNCTLNDQKIPCQPKDRFLFQQHSVTEGRDS
jgi:hypothetical protein